MRVIPSGKGGERPPPPKNAGFREGGGEAAGAGPEHWCDIPAQGLIGLIGYSYQQVATSFPEAGHQRTPRLSVLGPEQFGDG